jgi:hypothetical protein
MTKFTLSHAKTHCITELKAISFQPARGWQLELLSSEQTRKVSNFPNQQIYSSSWIANSKVLERFDFPNNRKPHRIYSQRLKF